MLTITGLSVNYGQSRILTNVDLRIEPGQVVCLMGRNGVGKTTTLKAIIGALKAQSGQIMFDGKDITHMLPHQRARSGIGYVPQGRGIFPYLTVYENLLMGFEAVPAQKINPEAIAEMYAQFPILRTMQARVAGTLSGGQQQQLANARALVSRPKLLVLDEPTEGIQPSIVQEIEALIESLKGKMAILLVEQFLDFALSIADQCHLMEKGTIVYANAAEHIQESVIKEYLAV